MNDVIEQQLISLLQPLLGVTLKKRDSENPEVDFADLEIVSVSVKGMGNEVAQGTDKEGNLLNFIPHQAEIAIRYFGADGVSQLSALLNQLQRISVLEQFQRANIGIGRLEKVETVKDSDVKEERVPHAEIKFSIHYTVVIKDAVGVIEHINAAHDDGEINIHLTR